MEYVWKIDTPANTLITSPKTTIAQLSRGRLNGGFVYYPSGASGTLNLQIRWSLHQLAPYNTDQSYALDDCVVPLRFSFDLISPPFQLSLVTWNTSATYEHTLTVGIFLEPFSKKRWGIINKMLSIVPSREKS